MKKSVITLMTALIIFSFSLLNNVKAIDNTDKNGNNDIKIFSDLSSHRSFEAR